MSPFVAAVSVILIAAVMVIGAMGVVFLGCAVDALRIGYHGGRVDAFVMGAFGFFCLTVGFVAPLVALIAWVLQ
jgi:hypothetical protein